MGAVPAAGGRGRGAHREGEAGRRAAIQARAMDTAPPLPAAAAHPTLGRAPRLLVRSRLALPGRDRGHRVLFLVLQHALERERSSQGSQRGRFGTLKSIARKLAIVVVVVFVVAVFAPRKMYAILHIWDRHWQARRRTQ